MTLPKPWPRRTVGPDDSRQALLAASIVRALMSGLPKYASTSTRKRVRTPLSAPISRRTDRHPDPFVLVDVDASFGDPDGARRSRPPGAPAWSRPGPTVLLGSRTGSVIAYELLTDEAEALHVGATA